MDLKKLGVKELASLQTSVKNELQKKQKAKRSEVLKQIKALLSANGMTLADIAPAPRAAAAAKAPKKAKPAKAKKARAKVAAKYCNPADATQTWTGRGRKPLWVVAFLAKGGKMESVAI